MTSVAICRGPLLSLLSELEQLVFVNKPHRDVQEKSFGQLEFPDLSWEVAREAVLNARNTPRLFPPTGSAGLPLSRPTRDRQSRGVRGAASHRRMSSGTPGSPQRASGPAPSRLSALSTGSARVDRIFENLLRLGKDVPTYSADEAHVRLTIPCGPMSVRALVAQKSGARRLSNLTTS